MTMSTQAMLSATGGTHRLDALLNARSVAVVGASNDPGKISGRPIAYMLARGYTGEIYPVNPGRQEVQGLRCYPSVGAIGKPVDLAIIGTAAAHVEAAVREGIASGVKAFVIFSSGFAELNDAGRALQERLTQLAQEHGVAIVGPNCLGIANASTGLIATFTTALESHVLRQGRFSLVSQSGALGAYWMDIVLRSGIGFSHWITTGNECNVDAAEAIDFLVSDPNTEVIGLYLEDVRRTEAFRLALDRAARAGKPVIAIKAGRSSAGAAAAASHTGALAGDDALYDACLSQHGALRVESLTEMMDAARLLLHKATPLGPKLAVMTVSGGAGVLIADACEPRGLELPALRPDVKDALVPVLPSFVHPSNPLDITGNVLQDTPMIGRAMRCLAEDKDTHAIVLFIGMMHSIADAFVQALSQARKEVHCPIVVIWVGALESSIQALEAVGIPVFLDIPQATTAMSRCLWAATAQKAIATRPLAPALVAHGDGGDMATTLSEWDGKQLLSSQTAVTIPQGWLLQEGAPLPVKLPFPLVAKLQSPRLLHKSDAGGVILRIQSVEALQAAAQRLFDLGRELELPVQGVLVEQMLPFDHELLLGLRRDARFGPVLTIARGGVEAELDPDVVNLLLPASQTDIAQAIGRLRCAKLLHGFRGKAGADIGKLSSRIAELCSWFTARSLREVEINPFAIRGDDAWALDALITPQAA
ncbi:acetate--CoA ligase family protein [Cupriavidus pinatubonensis]|uniref:acetate--CoA ligase family protein n=1 Tax=Cupriavidus pinatubonensis TaxID=248026 RepID=UPI001129602D|nr:acetate--CoA ligase family protein [Cupriavidus pinatubonensis]TPQ27107.1 CoA-binding protein [Cupriavidus pinatubonensis]